MKQGKKSPLHPSLLLAAIDVSARELVVAMAAASAQDPPVLRTYSNAAAGHRQLLRELCGKAERVRVAMEATGVYGLSLALCLQADPRVEVMVINPRAVKDFLRAGMKRAKTDKADALGILEYLRRMPFVAWSPPEADVLALQAITRRLTQLKGEMTREQNRLHAIEQVPSMTKGDRARSAAKHSAPAAAHHRAGKRSR
jgi:transposase